MLTVIAVKNASSKDKDYKLAGSGGLHLFVTVRGHKSWRFKYRYGGKEKRLIFGSSPEMTLSEARERRDSARRQLRDGIDPALAEKRKKFVNSSPSTLTFETFARSWYALKARDGKQCMQMT